MATHSSILAWRIPWAEEPGGCSSQGCKELDTTEVTWQNCTAFIGLSKVDRRSFSESQLQDPYSVQRSGSCTFSAPLAKKVTSDVQFQTGVLKFVYGKAHGLFSITLSNKQISLGYKRDQLCLNTLIKNIKVFVLCVCMCVCVFSCSVMSESL